ncbi:MULTISPECIES: glycosyltransferase family 4 protein [Vibrio]|uniref:glycosyltransferase family 4 protein n=1 Tax=Vibrio TaxID=662 RepID=UPI001BD55EC9|nr:MULTISPECIES: glycosyltransferase family 4 protein [Vibrio]EGQ9715604.1 glycosyltransferase family 4 protein [Vibrio alginolyticus]ELI1597853.1 glycosyltransferase family 4 protein [Vibrio alginolyticus]MBT0089785.1 glycosyltransferase family 4 protein [Vibrio alginolyticus]MDW2175305.1 glycosyltransferase family 4 protein [Vibrio sp. 1637]MDW2457047.1 glycosyltransferase family 4 protein [Vibrio sp. 1249-1]
MDKKPSLKIFSTALKSGKGGISTALVGYVSTMQDRVDLSFIDTHAEGSKLSRFWNAVKEATKVKPSDYCWFHIGPWFSMVRKLFLICICHLKHATVISHLHSPRVYDYLSSRRYKWLLELIVKLSDKVIVLTPWWKSLLTEAFPQYQDKFVISSNPADEQLESLAMQDIRRKRGEKIKVLSMARLEVGKGVDKTVLAFKHLPENYTLTIAGTGNQEAELKQIIAENHLEHKVSMLGWIDYEEKTKLLSSTDVFCLPSKLDSFGMVYIEAMAANLPIVALNYQAIPDVVPAFAGKLIDSDDESTIAHAIIQASDMCFSDANPKPSEFVMKKYNSEKITKEFLKNVCC